MCLLAVWTTLPVAHAEMLVNKNFSPTTIDAGGTSTLGLIITNNVAATATNTNLADDLPAGIVLLGPPLTNSCQGTVTNASGSPVVAGDTTIRLVNGVVPPGSAGSPVTCSVTFAVTNYTPNQSLINSIPAGSLTSSEGPNNDPASATLNTNPVSPFGGSKTVTPAFVHGGGTASFTVVFTNTNLTSATFTVVDSLPTGISMTNVAGISSTCGGSLLSNLGATLVDNSGGFRIQGGTLPGRAGANPGACTITFTVVAGDLNSAVSGNVTNAIPANFTNSLSAPTPALSRNLSLQTGGKVNKGFSPATLVVPADSVLTIDLLNRNLQTITGAVVTDNLPAFVTINGTPSASASCGPGVNFTTAGGGALTIGSSSIRINNAEIPASDNTSGAAAGLCRVTVTVRLTAEGTYLNNIGNSSFGAGLPGFQGTGNIPLVGSADLAGTKTFVPATRSAGGTTSLVITLFNNSASGVANVQFTDNLRTMSALGSVTVLSSPAITNNCSGAVSFTSTSFSLTGGFLNAGTGCQISVPVKITETMAAGNYDNTLPAGTISSTAGTNSFAIVGRLTVQDPLVVTKAFVPNVVVPNSTAQFTITLTRRTANGAPDLTNLSLTDLLPSGVVNATTTSLFTNCGGTASASPGGSSITLSGGAITGLSTNCLVRLSVLVSNSATNTIAVGSVTTAEGFSNRVAATAAVQAGGTAPNFVLNKDFSPQSVKGGEAARLSLSITNNGVNNQALTGVSLVDVFPTNGGSPAFVISNPPNASVTGAGCTVGAFSAVLGSDTFAISNAAVPVNGICNYLVNVVGYDTGTFNNQINAGAVVSAQGATNSNIAQKSLVISSAMTIGKSFSPTVISAGQSSTLTIVVLNTTNTQLTGTSPAFTDVLPVGVTVTAVASTDCTNATVTAPIGTRTITVNGGVYPANSQCSIRVPVMANAIGGYTNVIAAGSAVFNKPVGTETNAGTATAILAVVAKPTISKSFAPTSIAQGGTAQVVLTITNPNGAVAVPGGLTGMQITDTLPSGLSVAGNQALTGSCGGAGSVNLSNGATTVMLGPLSVGSATNCNVIFIVTAANSGTFLNTTTGVSSNETGTVGTGSNVATLTVLIPPAIAKSFTPSLIDPGQTATLLFTLSNPNAVTVTLGNPAFSDVFPSTPVQMTLANLLSSNSCGGVLNNSANTSLAVGDIGIRLNNGQIPPAASCTLSVQVSGASPGTYTNVTTFLSSTNAGASTSTAQATLAVTQPTTAFAVSKTNAVSALVAGSTTSYTVTVANLGPVAANNAVLTDVPTTGLLCTSVVCAGATGGASCPPIGSAPYELSIDNLTVNGVKLPIFPNGGQVQFVVNCNVTATGR